MKRRVIKQGHNTMTITLPSSWAQKHGISAGDELDIIEQEKNLIIHAERGSNNNISTITVDISEVNHPPINGRACVRATH